jgi:hypothetical protein
MSQRQRGDMKVLAHIREQYRLALRSALDSAPSTIAASRYGRPRMALELGRRQRL